MRKKEILELQEKLLMTMNQEDESVIISSAKRTLGAISNGLIKNISKHYTLKNTVDNLINNKAIVKYGLLPDRLYNDSLRKKLNDTVELWYEAY